MRLLHHKCVLALASLALFACGSSKNNPASLTTVREVNALSANELASPHPVHLRGAVTYGAPESAFYFLADRTGGIRLDVVDPGRTQAVYGDEVEVTGVVAAGARAPVVARARITRVGRGNIPPPEHAIGEDLDTGRYESRRVIVSGVLMSSAISNEASKYASRELHVRVDGHTAVVRMEDNKIWTDAPVDSEVEVTGVVASQVDVHGVTTRSLLWATGLDSVRYTSKPTPGGSLAVLHVKDLLAMPSAGLPAHRIRLRGKVAGSGNSTVLDDDTGRIRLQGRSSFEYGESNTDIAGFATARNGAIVIEDAAPAIEPEGRPVDARGSPRALMTSAGAIHRMPLRQASLRFPVQLKAVVTYHNLHDNLLFVQDAGDGIFVWAKGLNTQLNVGDLVQVDGVTGGGGFAPSVGGKVTVVGRGQAPQPLRGMEEEAFLGHFDSRWIEIKGVVQSVKGETLTLAWGTHTIQAQIYRPAHSLQSLTGASVTVRGVAAALTNKRRQLLGLMVDVPSEEYLQVTRAGPANPFLTPVQFASDLLAFSPSGNADRRARVRGVVTLVEPSGTLWLRDASGGVQVQPHSVITVRAGDSIDASGLPSAGAYSVVLRDADIRRVGSGTQPEPFPVDPTAGFRPELDAQLVRLDATLLSEASGPDGPVMLMQAGSVPFQARVVNEQSAGGWEAPPPGTLLRLAGIYSVAPAENGETMTRSFRLTVGSKDQIVVLRRVSWWTAARLLTVILFGFLVILAAAAWVILLRREVRTRVAEADAAVERANTAEWNESRQKQVLDLIARHAGIQSIGTHMAETIGELHPGIEYALIIARENVEQLVTTTGVPENVKLQLQKFTANEVLAGRRPQRLVECAWFYLSFPVVVGEDIRGSLNLLASSADLLESVTPEAMTTWVNMAAMTIERHDLYDRLSFRATHDALTELPNRLAFAERLESEVLRSQESGQALALCYIDLDKFKSVNDTFGHETGDLVLKEMARRIQRFIRPTDTAARLGGDEFIVMMPAVGGRVQAEELAARIAASLRRPIHLGSQDVNIGASVGISLFPEDATDADSLLRLADMQMYRQKHGRPEEAGRDVTRLAGALKTEDTDCVLHLH